MSPKLKNLSKDFDFELYSSEIKKVQMSPQIVPFNEFYSPQT